MNWEGQKVGRYIRNTRFFSPKHRRPTYRSASGFRIRSRLRNSARRAMSHPAHIKYYSPIRSSLFPPTNQPCLFEWLRYLEELANLNFGRASCGLPIPHKQAAPSARQAHARKDPENPIGTPTMSMARRMRRIWRFRATNRDPVGRYGKTGRGGDVSQISTLR